jgi:ADP-ribosylglycohydrolase
MIGAIAGDVIGSVYERRNIKTTEFPLFHGNCCFTDDTVLTVAVADSILKGAGYGEKLKDYYRHYPFAGYGGSFQGLGSVIGDPAVQQLGKRLGHESQPCGLCL